MSYVNEDLFAIVNDAVAESASHTRFRGWQKPETGLSVFDREVGSIRELPVAFLANGIFIVTCAGFELTTPVL